MDRRIVALFGIIGLSLAMPIAALAHVSVKPNLVEVASRQSFAVGVPNEKDMPTTQIKLVIPEGLKSVTPNVKPGWTIEITKTGEGDDATVSEILWKGGTIPAGQRDDFLFSAQAPSNHTELVWKAYQMYEDGTEVAWDKNPDELDHDEHEGGTTGPYSITVVDDDISAAAAPAQPASQLEQLVGPAAFVLSLFALYFSLRKKPDTNS